MTLRPPQGLGADRDPLGPSPIELELLAEKAAALGATGRRVEAALAALRACPAPAGSPEREALVDAAADTVWGFLVQRELCGLRDRERVIADYWIPAEVLARGGAHRRAAPAQGR